jgi:ATP-dependent helicase HrpA
MTTDLPGPGGISAATILFPPELPISSRVDDIVRAIQDHQVVIVAGATGSGKTTQLPKIALSMGRGRQKRIGVTQPRRIAATSVAQRVANELKTPLGSDVGYQIRFEDRTSQHTAIKFMTDGILLAEIQGDATLRRYDTIIVDEAHERSLTIDFLLGWLKRILPQRPDLKVIVSSATLETERFSEFFNGAPVIQVEGRTYPVDVLYQPPADDIDLADAVADAVVDVTSLDPHGDMLVFLPGEREIRETENAIVARNLRNTVVQPLYARLSAADQGKVFTSISQRRVILATNVAETSVTIPGIVYVIDTGLARLSRYDARSGITRLQIEAISRASAEQRKGRCGRVRDGICVRLYHEESFAARPGFTDPEIKRTGLAGVILRMKSLGLGNVEEFSFLDPPQARSITEGYRVLEELGAIDASRELTALGKQLARFPVDPRIARMILASAEYDCLEDMLVIASALNLQDPRERPRALQQKADDAHKRFRDERSDFGSLLKLWDFVREAEQKGTSHLRRTCKDNFLSFLRVREWRDVYRQLEEVMREFSTVKNRRGAQPAVVAKPTKSSAKQAKEEDVELALDAPLHRALLTGLLSKIGQWHPQNRVYMGTRETRFSIHPSSALSKKAPQWVMAFELVETTQLFARTVARIEPEWLLEVGSHLVKKSYSDAHWSEKNARALVRESATLFGMQIFKDRNVDYANVSPAQARLMFLDHALVRGEFTTRATFHEKNRKVLEQVSRLRDKARRSDMVISDDALLDFFDRRVSLDVVNGKTFETWRAMAEARDPNVLVLSVEDVLVGEADLVPSEYPDTVSLHGVALPLTYCFDPAAEEDGVTVTVPLVLLPQIGVGELDWIIPAWHREKIAAVLGRVPKALKKNLGLVSELAEVVASELVPFDGPMLPALASVVHRLTGVHLPLESLQTDMMLPYLRLTLRIVDENGKVIAQSRDINDLLGRYSSRARAAWQTATPAPSWERKSLTTWDFGELPPFVTRRVGGIEVRSYPSLIDRQTSVDLTLLESSSASESANRKGMRRLIALCAREVLFVASQRIPGAFPKLDGSPLSRSDHETFRSLVLMRIVEDAFIPGRGSVLPTNKSTFESLIREGTPRVDATSRRYADAIKATTTELEKFLQALRIASRHPSGSAAMKELRTQLEGLFSPTLMETVSLARLIHFPRYLRAAQVRLGRAVEDPMKDAGKFAPFKPVWESFLTKCGTTPDQDAAVELRWLFEELRVAIFAPELTTPVSVSLPKIAAAVSALR